MVNINKIPNLSIIVAMAQNQAIGKDNDLLWHISDDLRRFKSLTSGHPVIMGRNTWNSLPRRPLPKRRNIVLTHNEMFNDDGAEVAHSLQAALDLVCDEEESFVIGGAEIYRQFIPFVHKIFVTWVWQDFEADAFFPIIDLSRFSIVADSGKMIDPVSSLQYSYVEYELKKRAENILK